MMKRKLARLMAGLITSAMLFSSLPMTNFVAYADTNDETVSDENDEDDDLDEDELDEEKVTEVSRGGVTQAENTPSDDEDSEDEDEDAEAEEEETVSEDKASVENIMLAHYSFSGLNEVSDGTVIPNESEDTADRGYDAYIRGNGAIKHVDHGLYLPGGAYNSGNAYVELPAEVFEGRKNLTISAWFLSEVSGDYAGMYFGTKAQSTNNRPVNYWLLNPAKNWHAKSVMTAGDNVSEPYTTETSYANNKDGETSQNWYMITTVIEYNAANDSDIIKTYLNGKLINTDESELTLSDFGKNFAAYIGKSEYKNDPLWEGSVKDVYVYDYVLSNTQIANLAKENPTEKKEKKALVTAKSYVKPTVTEATIDSGETYTLPESTTVTLSDGSKSKAYFKWYDENGDEVSDTSELTAGTHKLTGKVDNYFKNPFIAQRADPHVFLDKDTGMYYFTASYPAYNNVDGGYDRITLRKADTLEGLADAEEVTVWSAGSTYRHVWAPEIHKINGKWYIFYAMAPKSSVWTIRSYVMSCSDEDPTTGSWSSPVQFMNKDGGYDGANDSMTLDMTYFEDKNGQGYVIWAHFAPKSHLFIGKVDKDDPTKLTSDPIRLSFPEFSWERVNEIVNEGPGVIKKDGKIYVTYSAAATGPEYCVGLLTAKDGDDLLDVSNWTKASYPILESEDLYQEYGPGHNSFTYDAAGNPVIVYHARGEECYQDRCEWAKTDPLYDPCRDARLAYVRFDEDGPNFSSTAYRELANLSPVTFSLKVNETEEDVAADPVLNLPLYNSLDDISDSNVEATIVGTNNKFDNGFIINGGASKNAKNYINITDADLLKAIQDSGKVTISAWVRNDVTGNQKTTVFTLGADQNNYFAFNTLNWDNPRASFKVGGTENTTGCMIYNTPGTKNSITGKWYPVTIELIDKSEGSDYKTEIKYFMNYELVVDTETTSSIKQLGDLSFLRIGGSADSDSNFYDMQGGIRNFRIYTEKLSPYRLMSNDNAVAADDLIALMGAEGENNALTISEDMELPDGMYPFMGCTWSSSNITVLSDDGVINGDNANGTAVILTATIRNKKDSAFKTTVPFKVTVNSGNGELLNRAYDELEIKNVDDVRENLTLPTESMDGKVKISWKSSNPSVISDTAKGDIAPGEVKRGSSAQTVTLTATLKAGGIERSKSFTAKVRKAAPAVDPTKYMFAYFTGNGAGQEQIYFADSEDGLNWKSLNSATPVLTSDLGEKGVRDPYIIRSPEGDKFYIIATDLCIANNDGGKYGNVWTRSQRDGSKYIMVWESTDLVNWSDQRMVKVALDTPEEYAGCTWAPEAYWDDEKGAYMVFWASMTQGDNGKGYHRIFRCYTRDFYSFTDPEVWITLYNTSGSPTSIIDTTVISTDNADGSKTYYRFSKNEGSAQLEGDNKGAQYIFVEKADSLSGTWTKIHSDTLLGNTGVEGPTIFKMNGEDTWCLLLDNFGAGGYYPLTSTNLSKARFFALSKSDYSMPAEALMRHGTVLPISEHEYAEIEKKWGNIVEEADKTGKIASFTFDDATDGMKGSGAKARVNGSLSLSDDVRAGATGKSVNISSAGWLNIEKENGDPLLTGLDEFTVSYWRKPVGGGGKGWSFYASAKDHVPSWPNEHYIGFIDLSGSMEVQRWYNSGSRAATIINSTDMSADWQHITVVFSKTDTKLYVNGSLKNTLASSASISSIMGSNSAIQIGKANWDSGEYYTGLMDDLELYNIALDAEQVAAIYGGQEPEIEADPIPVTYISVEPTDGTADVELNTPYGLTASVLPTNADDTSVTWSSDDTSVATVDTDGNVTFKKYGQATIKATAADGSEVYGEITLECEEVFEECTVTFNANGGELTCDANLTALVGQVIDSPSAPIRDNYVFIGWAKDSTGSNMWKFASDKVAGNITLYAVWEDAGYGDIDIDDVIEAGFSSPSEVPKGELWIAGVEDRYYTGKAVTQNSFRVYYGKKLLTEGTDYSVKYSNNIKAGVAAMTLTGKTNFVGNMVVNFNVLPLDIDEAVGADLSFAFTGNVIKGEPTLSYRVEGNTVALKKGTDYVLEYPGTNEKSDDDYDANAFRKAGEYTILVNGKGNYTGVKEIKQTISRDVTVISKAAVSGIVAKVPYTGEEITQDKVVVKLGKVTLVEGEDYELSYANNVEVGTATVFITAKADSGYAGTITKTFAITGTPIKNAKVAGFIASKPFTGAQVEQPEAVLSTTVTVGKVKTNVILEEGEDYIVEYQNNVQVGKATVIYRGIGGYTGELKKTYSIAAFDMSKATESQIKVEYDETVPYAKGGANVHPKVIFTSEGRDYVLVENKDYKVKYTSISAVKSSTDKAAPTVTITGMKNFKGSVARKFSIVPADIATVNVLAKDSKKSQGVAPSVVVTDSVTGGKLAMGTDYDKTFVMTYVSDVSVIRKIDKSLVLVDRNAGDAVDKADMIPVGTEIRVTITGKGNYTGTVNGIFRVIANDIASAKVAAITKTYTGSVIKLGKDDIKLTLGKTTLTSDDFEIIEYTYTNNINKGTGKVTIRGVGEYGGTKDISFKIAQKNIKK